MAKFKLCYVTAFLDIGRDDWTQFQRSVDDYLTSFVLLVNTFKEMTDNRHLYHLLIFIDARCAQRVRALVEGLFNVTVVEIDEEFLIKNSPIWSRLPRETEIMNSTPFKQLMAAVGRGHFPEHTNPKYTLINNAKIDLLVYAMGLSDCFYFCWVDFGYFAYITLTKVFEYQQRLPQFPLRFDRFDLDKINYTLINPLTEQDRSVGYTLAYAPERMGGFFFFASRRTLPVYQQLFNAVHAAFQQANIADDDQHVALQCYFNHPELFTLHHLGGWHRALTHFQATSSEPFIPSLTEIMNRHGSDKGSGHHNYTTCYAKLFEPLRQEHITLLEIGIGTVNPGIRSSMCGTPGGYSPGSSLRGWAEYFPNAAIYGCDIDRDILFQTDRISTFYLDQTDQDVITTQILNENRTYDVIIDDGLHHFPTNWSLLKAIFSKLNAGGYYIIEDISDFQSSVYEDPFAATIEFRYVQVPNPRNPADNNLVIARRKGDVISEL